jgi:hypothetical protein
MALSILLGCAGCEKRRSEPTVQIRNPWLGAMRIAVAPALNFSGSPEFDPAVVADIMASELSHVDGFEVVPVSRVLAVLARQNEAGIVSPAHASEVREVLGADAILVFAITEYDPYEMPVVGIAAQLYGTSSSERIAGFDPVLVSRSATTPAMRSVEAADEPLAQATRVYNASHEPTIDEVKAFARLRLADASPLGWRKYTASQQLYLRFCCHATIKELVRCGVNRRIAETSTHEG